MKSLSPVYAGQLLLQNSDEKRNGFLHTLVGISIEVTLYASQLISDTTKLTNFSGAIRVL